MRIPIKISRKVLNTECELERSVQTGEDTSSQPIIIVSWHGNYEKLLKTINNHEEDLLHTESFKNQATPTFQYVKKNCVKC